MRCRWFAAPWGTCEITEIGKIYACRRCCNFIFILDLISGFNGLGKDKCEAGRETFKFWDLVRLILDFDGTIRKGCFNFGEVLWWFKIQKIQKHLFDHVQTSIIQINGTMWTQIKYFLMGTCLETLVKAVWPLSQRPPGNVWKYWAH